MTSIALTTGLKALISSQFVLDTVGPCLLSPFLATKYREQLDPKMSLRRTLSETGHTVTHRDRTLHLAAWAKRFRFSPEQLDLPVELLSGGEQARAVMARLMLKRLTLVGSVLRSRPLEEKLALTRDFAGRLVLNVMAAGTDGCPDDASPAIS